MPRHEPREPEADSSRFLADQLHAPDRARPPDALGRRTSEKRRSLCQRVGPPLQSARRKKARRGPTMQPASRNHTPRPGPGNAACCRFRIVPALAVGSGHVRPLGSIGRRHTRLERVPRLLNSLLGPPKSCFAAHCGFQSFCRSNVGKTGNCRPGLELRPRSVAVQVAAMSRQCIRANHPDTGRARSPRL